MTTASAKVIIDAEDLASKKIAEAARNVERSVKNIKDVGGKAKASTEFIGTLANTLGGSQLGSYAGQLAQMTERISQFSEVSKAGGAGALAFKAGLVGVVGTLSFQFGKAIGDAVFGTKEFERALQKTKDSAAELKDELQKSNALAFADRKEDIELIRNPAEKRAAQEALFRQIENNIAGLTQQFKESEKAAEEWQDAWKITDTRNLLAEEAQKQFEIDKARLAQAKEQREEIRRELSDRKKINEQIRADNEAAKQAEVDAMRAREEAAAEQQKLIEKAEQARQQAEQKKVDEAKRIESIRQSEMDRLKEEKILLTEGAEAAKRFSLERQGIDKDSAAMIAAEQNSVEQLRESLKEVKPEIKVDTKLTAVESRLQTRGTANDPNAKLVDNTKAIVKELERLNKREEAKKTQTPLVFEVVGA